MMHDDYLALLGTADKLLSMGLAAANPREGRLRESEAQRVLELAVARFEETERKWSGPIEGLEALRLKLVEALLRFQLSTSIIVDKVGKYVPLRGRTEGGRR